MFGTPRPSSPARPAEIGPFFKGPDTCAVPKGGHGPTRAGLGPSRISARRKMARLGLARFSHEPEKVARLGLGSGSV
jgi:hypothetical protein